MNVKLCRRCCCRSLLYAVVHNIPCINWQINSQCDDMSNIYVWLRQVVSFCCCCDSSSVFFVRYQTLLFLLLERVFFHYFNFFTLNCHESSYYIHFTWIFFFFSSLTFCVFAHCREVFTAVSGYISLSMQQLHESISRYVCECQQRKMNMRTNYQLTEYNAIYGKNAFSIFNFLR